MDKLLKNLDTIFESSLFRIPDYQRGYSWTAMQLEEFWSDLLCLKLPQNHYTGMIMLKRVPKEEIKSKDEWIHERWFIEEDEKNEVYHVVDGQQRFTTIIILIFELLKHCEKNGISFRLDSESIEGMDEIKKKFFCLKHGNLTTYRFGYEANNPCCEYFHCRILEENLSKNLDESVSLYTRNLDFAKHFFAEKVAEFTSEQVKEIFQKLLYHFMFVSYKMDDEFNVYVAFEAMNNRGKKLSYLEILKNRLIYLTTLLPVSKEEKKDVRDKIHETWKQIYRFLESDKEDDDFLRDHWIIYFGYDTRKIEKNKNIPFYTYLLNRYFIQQNVDSSNPYIPTLEEVGYEEQEDDEESEETSNSFNQAITITLKDIEDYVNSLSELIPYWYQLHHPNPSVNPKIYNYLLRLNQLGFVNSKSLITVLLWDTISEEDKVECLKLIERYNLLYYRLNNYSSTSGSTAFYNLARDLYHRKITISDVKKTLSTIEFLSDNHVVVSNGITNKFEKLFKSDGFYSWSPYIKLVLYIYDNQLSSTLSERHLNYDEYFKQDSKDHYSLEHIYPQNPKKNDTYWNTYFGLYSADQRKRLCGSLGNLLPLSSWANSSLSNASFPEKKQMRYKNGSKSELEVARKRNWTPEDILERGMLLLNFMEKEWDFIIPNDKERKKILGLEFMASPRDEWKNQTVPYYEEKPNDGEKKFDLQQFDILKNGCKNNDLFSYYEEISNYCMSLDPSVVKYTTKNYIGFSKNQVFLEFHFYAKYIHLVLNTIEYEDPQGKIKRLGQNYNWSKKCYIDVYPGDDMAYIKKIIQQSYDCVA